jgi:hypothetical protein
MVFDNKLVYTFDIEVMSNCLIVSILNTGTQEVTTCEISARTNDLLKIRQIFTNKECWYTGYNCIHYDTPILNYILERFTTGNTYQDICQCAKAFSDIIIKDEMSEEEQKFFRYFKYRRYYNQIDLLTMLYSQKLRVGLKWIQVSMLYPNVQEMLIDWQKPIKENRIDEVIEYNINDIKSTAHLLTHLEDKLNLRLSLRNKYNIDVLSTDDVNLGNKLLRKLYCKRTNQSEKYVDTLRTPCDFIDLDKVILPIIKFSTPQLQAVLEDMRAQHATSPGRKGYEHSFLFAGMYITVGVGGIHGDCGIGKWYSSEDQYVWDSDVNSLYPSLMCVYNFYPPHLGKEFIELYEEIKDERLAAKKSGNKLINESYKLILNGTSGLLQQSHNWLYSPFTVMQVRINGQLLLLMLTEKLYLLGCSIKQINTDGILYTFHPKLKDEVLKIIQEWEQLTQLDIETEEFKSFYQLAINDYLGILTNNKIKEKGCFITKTNIGKGVHPTIIPIAIQEYLVNDTPIETTVRQEQDIKKFLLAEKTGKQWTVTYGGEETQHINRYYVSTMSQGKYLDKVKNSSKVKSPKPNSQDEETTSLTRMQNRPVVILNKIDDKPIANRGIDYGYYTSECRKIIEQLEPSQLSLW